MTQRGQSQKIRSSIKARGPPGPILSIQQPPPRPSSKSTVDNGAEAMVRQISGGGSRSGSPTPRNSPKSTRQLLDEYQMQQHQVIGYSGIVNFFVWLQLASRTVFKCLTWCSLL